MARETLVGSGEATTAHRNPIPTVDILIEMAAPSGRPGVILVKRAKPPRGWALPGGFINYGETAESAAAREALEETGLRVVGLRQFKVYSDPRRDPRQHTLTVVFLAQASGRPRGGDDAAMAEVFELDALPPELCFDHGQILADYLAWRTGAGVGSLVGAC